MMQRKEEGRRALARHLQRRGRGPRDRTPDASVKAALAVNLRTARPKTFEMESPKEIGMAPASIGIFWGIPLDEGGFVLLVDKSPCDQGESYGDAITHPIGHAEYWEGLARLGAAGLARRGLPPAPAWFPYEAMPRGRVVYWPKEERFIIYADHRLQTRSIITRIIAEFAIPHDRYVVRSDPHYRAARDLS